MSDTDVVVTGLGATTPLGGDVASSWQALLAGASGVRELQQDWLAAYELPVRIGAELAVEPDEELAKTEKRRFDRSEQLALVASRQAWRDASEPEVDPLRLAVVIGTGIGGSASLLAQDDVLETRGASKVAPLTIPMTMPNGPAAAVSLTMGAKGGAHAPVSACASGSEALAWAYRMLIADEVDVVLAGGAESCIVPVTIAGFAQMRAMSTRNEDPASASRPFDAGRDGFVLGEGSGIMVLERGEHARARGARVYASLAGIGTSSDAYHISAPEADGAGAARAIEKAVRSGDLEATDVGHVNCHATSTPVGDMAEVKAIHTALGSHPALTAPKASLGHLLGAAGAVEALSTVLTLHHQVVPPTRNLDHPDPELNLDVVTGSARPMTLRAAVTDSFGFGGHNVALAFTV